MSYFPTAGILFKRVFHEIFNISIFYQIDDPNKFSKELSRIADEKDFDFDRIRDYYEFLKQSKSIDIDADTADYIFNRIMLNLNIYKNMVLYLNVGFIDKESFNQILLKLLLATLIYETELFIHKEKIKGTCLFPEDKHWYLSYWNAEKEYPIAVFLKWLQGSTDKKSYNELADMIETSIHGGRGEDYTESMRRNWIRWCNKGQVIQRSTAGQWFGSEDTRKFILSFIIAGGYQTFISLKEEYKITSGLIHDVAAQSGAKDYKEFIQSLLNDLKYNNDNQVNAGIIHRKKLYSLETNKSEKDHETALSELDRIKDDQTIPEYYRYWLQAKYNVMINSEKKRKDALKLYKQAFESGKYSAGLDTLDIIKQYLTLACYLGKPEDVKLSYKWAYYYKLFEDKYIENESWFMDLQSKQFHAVFPPENYYQKFPNKNKESLKKQNSFFITLDDDRHEINDPNELVELNNTRVSILMKCCFDGKLDYVKELLSKGADPNYISKDGSTALIYALQNNYIEISELLLSCNLSDSINSKTKRKSISALSAAIDISAESLVKKILDKGADPDLIISMDNQTALYYAIQLISLFITPVEELLHKNMSSSFLKQATDALKKDNIYKSISPNVFDFEHMSTVAEMEPFIYDGCIKYLNNLKQSMSLDDLLKIVGHLLNAGADVNHIHHNLNDFTPLVFAAETGYLPVFELLYKFKPDIKILMSDGFCILHQVFNKNNFEMFNFIIEHTSAREIHKIKDSTNSAGNTPLHVLLLLYKKGKTNREMLIRILERFMDFNPCIDIKNKAGLSPLEFALELDNKLIVKLLSEKGMLKNHIIV